MNQTNPQEGILFSCRCKSLKRLFTLLSSLRSTNQTPSANTNTSILTSSADLLSTQNIARRAISLTNTGGDSSRGKRNKEQIAEIFVNGNGLTVHVYGVARQSQASVDLNISLFSDFYVHEEEMEIGDTNEIITGGSFSINLTTLLECLHALDSSVNNSYYTGGNQIELCMSYSTRDAILKLELLERSYNQSHCLELIGSAALAGVESSIDGKASALTMAFRSQEVLARAIVKSDFLRLAVVELEVAGATCCSLCIWSKGLELGVIGSCGESFVQLPYNSEDTSNQGFVSLEAPSKYVLCTYPLYLLLQAFRGLEIAEETCLTINASQMLAIQHQVTDPHQFNHNQPNTTTEPNYVDFIIASITDPSLDNEYGVQEENIMSINGEEDDDIPSVSLPQSDSQLQPLNLPPLQPEQLEIHSSNTTEMNDTTNSPSQSSPISNPRKRSSQSSKNKQKTKQPFLFTLNDDESSSTSNASTTDAEEDDYYYFTPPATPSKGNKNSNTQDDTSIASSPELMFGDTSLANVEKNCLVREDGKKKHWKR